jgi:hypothetical protein
MCLCCTLWLTILALSHSPAPLACARMQSLIVCPYAHAGTSFDGGGIGTNQPDTGVWQVYSAVGAKGGAVHAPTQLGGCSDGWHCSSTDGAGNSYDGNSGWQVVDSYSCRSGECGSYGVDHSIVATDGTTQLAEGGKVVLGDEVIDLPAGTGDVHVPADQIAPDMYAGGIFDLHQPISPLLAQTGTSSLASAPLGDEVFDFTGNAGDLHAPVEQYSTVDMYKPISPLLAQTGTSSLAAAKAPYVFQVNSDAGTCDFSCDQNAVCSEPVGACSSVKVGVVPSQTVCVGSTCINASDPNTITVQYALAPPPAIPTVEAQRAAVAQSSQKGVRPSPAHFVMAAHAAVYGYLTAYLLYWY